MGYIHPAFLYSKVRPAPGSSRPCWARGQGPGPRAMTPAGCVPLTTSHMTCHNACRPGRPAPARDGTGAGMATTRPVLPVPLHEATLTLQQGIRATARGLAPDTRNFPQRPTHQLTCRARHLARQRQGRPARRLACLRAFPAGVVFARNFMVLGLLRLSQPPRRRRR